jgi:acylphosphatase
MKHLDIIVHGKVQGVNFRHYTREQALALGVNGFVENRGDGTVYIEAEGNEEQMNNFVEWCRKGPARAEVKSIDKRDGEIQNYSSFDIRR